MKDKSKEENERKSEGWRYCRRQIQIASLTPDVEIREPKDKKL